MARAQKTHSFFVSFGPFLFQQEKPRSKRMSQGRKHVRSGRDRMATFLKHPRTYLAAAGVLLLFFAHYHFQPLILKSNIESEAYTLETFNLSPDNQWSDFKEEGKGKFFIHPGKNQPARGVFTFQEARQLVFDFSIEKGQPGEIEFSVLQNGKEVDKSVVAPQQPHQVKIAIQQGDQIEVIADKYGETSYDHGKLEIRTLKNGLYLLIPLLWSLLFLLLFRFQSLYLFASSFLLYLIIVSAEVLNFHGLRAENMLLYSSIIFAASLLSLFFYQNLRQFKKYRLATGLSFLLAFLIYAIPLNFIIYALNFDSQVSKDILYAAFQSNAGESYEFISDFIQLKYLFLFAGLSVVVFALLFQQEKQATPRLKNAGLLLSAFAFLGISFVGFSSPSLPTFFSDALRDFQHELEQFREVQRKVKAGEIDFSASKEGKGETYVVVIGESLNKRHMGIYGYMRNTTPRLSQLREEGKLLVFENAYANHTHTMSVLSMSLTEANQYNEKIFYNALSICHVLNKAEVETYWLSNQVIYGPWENQVSVIAKQADHVVAVNKAIGETNKTFEQDGYLIEKLRKVLAKKTKKNRVIFVHLMGSHTPYHARYPQDQFTVFDGPLPQGEFGKKTAQNGVINFYDNGVVYNDFVVSSMIQELGKKQAVSGLIYMADHADDVIRRLGHNADKFTYDMTQIPLLAWFSEAYQSQYGRQYENLRNHQQTLFSNDLLYNTLLGTFGIRTSAYEPQYDFSSEAYALNPRDALVLHGKRKYLAPENHLYWQHANAAFLKQTGQASRIFPHRVNSVGKLKDIWNDGFRSFEVDVRFEEKGSPAFRVGHNEGVMGLELEAFLSQVNPPEIEKIWLDFKNLTPENHKQALDRLAYLDQKFGLKEKVIVESGYNRQLFQSLSCPGLAHFLLPAHPTDCSSPGGNQSCGHEAGRSGFSGASCAPSR
jgi:heptose-I-phosphate ethanolaminephosphotransferase